MTPFRLFLVLILGSSFFTFGSDVGLLKKERNFDIDKILAESVKGHQIFSLNFSEVQKLLKTRPKKLELDIPFKEGNFHLILNQTEIFSNGIWVETGSTHKGTNFSYKKALHYRGEIVGHKGSLACISIFGNEVYGLFSGVGDFKAGNLVLAPIETEISNPKLLHLIYNDADLLVKPNYTCSSPELATGLLPQINRYYHLPNFPSRPFSSCRTVPIYFEADHTMFNDFNQDTVRLANYITAMFNVVAGIYERDSVKISISKLKINTQPDNYDITSSATYLDAFALAIDTNFPGNLAHGLTTSRNNVGGRAYLDVLCNKKYAHGISNIDPTFRQLPLYSWTVNVVSHELGHNFGSPHTQSCSWPLQGGLTGMLDSCYTPEGNCYTGPKIPKVGTIMSYCHLNGSIDLSKGFGPLPGTLIRNNFFSASCITGSALPTVQISNKGSYCPGDTALFSVSPISGASYQWSGPNGFSAIGTTVIKPLSASDTGFYSVVMTLNGCNTSPVVTQLQFNCLPVKELKINSVCPGQAIKFKSSSAKLFAGSNQFKLLLKPVTDTSNLFPLSITLPHTNRPDSFSVVIPANFPAGSYQVKLQSSSPALDGSVSGQLLTVKKAAPNLQNKILKGCAGTSFDLSSQDSTVSSTWFDSTGVLLTNGLHYRTPALFGRQYYWLKQTVGGDTLLGAKDTSISGGSYFNNFARGNLVSVFSALKLDSVSIYSDSVGMVVMNFTNPDSFNILLSDTFNISHTGLNRLAINRILQPGQYRVDAVGTEVNLFRNNGGGTNYPYTIPGIFSMATSNAGNNYYYFFYNWKLSYTGCYSTAKYYLNVNPLPPGPQIIRRNDTLFTSVNVSAPQWYLNGNLIPGATNLFYLPTTSGNFAVQTTDTNGCIAISNLFNYILGTYEPPTIPNNIVLVPNPANETVTFSWPNCCNEVKFRITDVTGRIFTQGQLLDSESRYEINLSNWPSGIYTFTLQSGQSVSHSRLVKN